MKKLAIVLALSMILTASAQDLQTLQANHMVAIQSHGNAALLRDVTFEFKAAGNMIVSVCANSDMASCYAENEGKKIYWTVKKEGECLIFTLHIMINGQEITRSWKICKGEASMSVQVIQTDERYDWMCLLKCVGGKVFECISCMTDWKCWATCAGPSAVSCVMGCF